MEKIAGLSQDHLIRINTSDNFWSAGDSGPCGPCSEIFYDQGPSLQGGPPGSPTGDGDRFMEIWNLVFMQYLQSPEKSERTPLPMPCVDTGMGLERIASVMQGVTSNFETDTFQTLIQANVDLTNVPYQGTAVVSHRIIADHLRAISFLIADGVLPSNEGRGYVLRRILRRAVRHAHLLNVQKPLLARLFPALSGEMGLVYPELLRASDLIQETLNDEECRFQDTLSRGLKVLEESLETLPPRANLSGAVAFKLYDTYGFPLDLTQDILKTNHRTVDQKEFDACMDKQRADARASWSGSGEKAEDGLWYDLLSLHGATHFMGYASPSGEAHVQALIQNTHTQDSVSSSSVPLQVLLNQTPFYGEAGGQLGDRGILEVFSPEGLLKGTMKITNTRKFATDLVVHEGLLEEGKLQIGDKVTLHIDLERRASLSANHTATHLLHAALHALVSKTITQKGSLVAPDRLRFDFNAKEPLSWALLSDIEQWINTKIQNNTPVLTSTMNTQEALDSGAMALFGQKYTDQVRVVSIHGTPRGDLSPTSTELCGGTHVEQTGSIGLFKIISHSSVSSGVRRIEALTGLHALQYTQEQEAFLRESAGLLKIQPQGLLDRLKEILKEKKSSKAKDILSPTKVQEDRKLIGNNILLTITLENQNDLNLKAYAETLKSKLSSGLVLIVNISGSKSSLALGVTDNLVPTFQAVELIRALALKAGGQGGGGNDGFAQSGGKSHVSIPLLTAFLEEKMQHLLKKS